MLFIFIVFSKYKFHYDNFFIRNISGHTDTPGDRYVIELKERIKREKRRNKDNNVVAKNRKYKSSKCELPYWRTNIRKGGRVKIGYYSQI
jgi:hypothetical protein